MEDFIEHLERLGIIAVDSVSNMIAKRNSKNVMEKTQIEILNQQQYKQKVYRVTINFMAFLIQNS